VINEIPSFSGANGFLGRNILPSLTKAYTVSTLCKISLLVCVKNLYVQGRALYMVIDYLQKSESHIDIGKQGSRSHLNQAGYLLTRYFLLRDIYMKYAAYFGLIAA
jgi:hypothetical protein